MTFVFKHQSIIKNYDRYVINLARPLATKLRQATACAWSGPQATSSSDKLQAPSESNNKPQASSSSSKHQAQATSIKLQDLEPRKSFTCPNRGLNADEAVVWMLTWEGYLMW